nr:sulfatase [Gammaproteobacteria bacterium]
MSSLQHRHSLHALVVFALSALALDLVLILPNHPVAASWKTLLLFPLELPFVLLALIAIGDRRVGRALRIALVALLTVITALKLADFGMYCALNRGFNPVADLRLIASLYDLLVGAAGRWAATGAVLLS